MSPTDRSTTIRQRVREAARDRCGYCLSQQQYVMGKLETEHIIPHARGGGDDESNLWLSCRLCNRYKGSQITGVDPFSGARVTLFSPRTQVWSEHFRGVQTGRLLLV
jgi:5-methylcytosine-specific restriction endonuclease McrA